MQYTSHKKTIFVGMLSDDMTGQDVRLMFERFGTVVKCGVLQHANGRSKHCAFVTFTCAEHAAAAVERMHRSQTMEGRRYPLVVEFADSQTEKEQRLRRQLQSRAELLGGLRLATGGSDRKNASVEQCPECPFVLPANDDVNALQIGLDATSATGHSTAANNADLQQHLDRNLLLTDDAAQLNLGPGHVLPNPTFTGYPQNPTFENLSIGNPFERPIMIQNMIPLVASNPVLPTGSTGSSILSVPAQHPGLWPSYAVLSTGTNPFAVQPQPFQAGLPLCYTTRALPIGYCYFNAI